MYVVLTNELDIQSVVCLVPSLKMLNVFISIELHNFELLCFFFFSYKIAAACCIQNDFIMDYSGLSNTPEVPQVAAFGELTGRRSVIQQ